MKALLISTILLISTGYFTITVYKTEVEKRRVKEDLIELSKIKYGLFNVDEWKRILSDIITKKIEAFNLEGRNKEKMRKELEVFLLKIISDLEERYYEEKSQSFFGILIQNPITSITGVFGKIKRDIPVFTEQILNFLNDPKNRNAIRAYILSKLNDYADKTFSKLDYTTHDQILSNYDLRIEKRH